MPVITQLAALLRAGKVPSPHVNKLTPDTLVKLIVSRDRIPDPARNHPKGYIHVSGLIRGDCPRFLSLQKRLNHYPDNRVNGATRIMWKLGRAAEQHVRDQLIAALPSEQVWGNWRCHCGKRRREGHSYDKDTCIICGHRADIYEELDLENDTYFVTGHPDFIVFIDGKIYPIEIKSLTNSKSANAKGEGFDSINGPFVNHVLQVSCYHRMLMPLSRRLGLPLAEQALVLYVSKDFNGFQVPYPYKEFHVNPYEYKPQIQTMFEEAKSAYLGAKGMLPQRLTTCANASTKCASKCSLVHPCFAAGNGIDLSGKKIVVTRLRE